MPAPLPLSAPAARALAKLGHDVALARRRRRLTQASLAERAGIARKTLTRLEKGDPKVALEYLARVLHVLGEVGRLEQLLDTGADEAGLLMMDENLPQRVRARKSTGAW
ncbi:MAG: helix-turn-helix transcriptional regulator [Steroidobacteraceae bacterium]